MTQRPRDALGRPLGLDADAALVVPGVPADAGASDDGAWAMAMAYLADGRPFHSHEVFEARWRACPAADRAAWRALAQWGAALTHDARGNAVGARRLADRAQAGLMAAPQVPACIDVARVRASCDALASG
jgi:uncharacterized protein